MTLITTNWEKTSVYASCGPLVYMQVDRMKEEGYVKEGEIQLLRDNLKQRDNELDALKQERINTLHQQNVHTTEREKQLQVIVECNLQVIL